MLPPPPLSGNACGGPYRQSQAFTGIHSALGRWLMVDFAVVGLSLVGLAPLGLPVGMILATRAIRVVLLFRKLQSLRKLLTALSYSVLPMMNAFVIIFVIASVCACARFGTRNPHAALLLSRRSKLRAVQVFVTSQSSVVIGYC